MCCANCALYPVSTLREKGVAVEGLWFNPNIHPYTEYAGRLDALRKLQESWKLDVTYIDYYGLEEYLRNVVGNEESRCSYCYTVRLGKTAEAARQMHADAFTTSLLVSPYQKFDAIIEIGNALQDRYDIEFYAEDFRGGFGEGRKWSREMGLYRQKYCGCIYSEMERYNERKKSGIPNPES